MNIEEIREYCICKKGVSESFPFDEVTLVFKVMNKIFAITSTEGELFINLKSNPEKAIELREKYPEIKPGWHMNKKHWNSVFMNGNLGNQMIASLIDDSYEMIVSSLPKKLKEELANM